MSEVDLPPEYLEVLSPLRGIDSTAGRPGVRSDVQQQAKELLDMHSRFRKSESSFAQAYTQVTSLEKDITSCKESWKN